MASTTSPPPAAGAANGKPALTKEDGKVKLCTGHTRPICHICYSKIVDGTFWFVTSCHDAKPMLRNGETGDWVGTFEGHKGAVYCSAFNDAATRLVTGSGDYSAMVWDALTGQTLHSWLHPHYIKSVDWSDNKIVTGNYDSNVRIFDAVDYDAKPRSIAAFEKGIVKAVYFAQDTQTVVAASDATIKVWDLRTEDKVAAQTEMPGLNVLEYTHEHSLVAAHGKTISFLHPTSLQLAGEILTAEDVECASLSPDGRNVACGSRIKVKEFAMDGTELESHRGHHGPIFHVRWAPDGTTFASGSEDGMVRVWPSHDIISRAPE